MEAIIPPKCQVTFTLDCMAFYPREQNSSTVLIFSIIKKTVDQATLARNTEQQIKYSGNYTYAYLRICKFCAFFKNLIVLVPYMFMRSVKIIQCFKNLLVPNIFLLVFSRCHD
jgi:hypothetical protein